MSNTKTMFQMLLGTAAASATAWAAAAAPALSSPPSQGIRLLDHGVSLLSVSIANFAGESLGVGGCLLTLADAEDGAFIAQTAARLNNSLAVTALPSTHERGLLLSLSCAARSDWISEPDKLLLQLPPAPLPPPLLSSLAVSPSASDLLLPKSFRIRQAPHSMAYIDPLDERSSILQHPMMIGAFIAMVCTLHSIVSADPSQRQQLEGEQLRRDHGGHGRRNLSLSSAKPSTQGERTASNACTPPPMITAHELPSSCIDSHARNTNGNSSGQLGPTTGDLTISSCSDTDTEPNVASEVQTLVLAATAVAADGESDESSRDWELTQSGDDKHRDVPIVCAGLAQESAMVRGTKPAVPFTASWTARIQRVQCMQIDSRSVSKAACAPATPYIGKQQFQHTRQSLLEDSRRKLTSQLPSVYLPQRACRASISKHASRARFKCTATK
jgi:hypothetical protein